ncbi:MAG: 50S ribosomal protein L15 [Candidatus Omnitrophota bacterium]
MEKIQISKSFKFKKVKRVGRGTGSGRGKTSSRGNKGAGQRAGKKLPYAGFCGGNLPLFRRIPKRGFNPCNRKDFSIVNLKDINLKLASAKEVNPQVLLDAGLIKTLKKPVKILASVKGEFGVRAVFKVDKMSLKAKEIIEGSGGKVEQLSPSKK